MFSAMFDAKMFVRLSILYYVEIKTIIDDSKLCPI